MYINSGWPGSGGTMSCGTINTSLILYSPFLQSSPQQKGTPFFNDLIIGLVSSASLGMNRRKYEILPMRVRN